MKAEIKDNKKIANGVYKMSLLLPDKLMIKPGQFVNVYLDDSALLLPRPISVNDFHNSEDGSENAIDLIYGVVGKGTEELSRYEAGREIRILGPLGNGFDTDVRSGGSKVLIGGGLGIPPLLYLAKQLTSGSGRGKAPVAVLGFSDEIFLIDEFREICSAVYVSVEDIDSCRKAEAKAASVNAVAADTDHIVNGTVIDAMSRFDITGDDYYACGPLPMLKALSGYLPAGDLQVSLEERMGCGYGACVGCSHRTVSGLKKICKDGPVFRADEVIWDEDRS